MGIEELRTKVKRKYYNAIIVPVTHNKPDEKPYTEYWIMPRDGGNPMRYIGKGDTRKKAWEDALKHIENGNQ